MKKALTYLVVLLLLSCNREDRLMDKLDHAWIIDEITYKNRPYTDSLRYNVLGITKHDIGLMAQIPATVQTEREYVFAELLEKDDADYLKLNSQNKMFAGVYKISFIKDPERKLLGIELTSDSLKIKAFKLTLDYSGEAMDW